MVKAMLRLIHKLTHEAPHKDVLAASVIVAKQRNAQAAENLRDLISEVLDENDRLRKKDGAR